MALYVIKITKISIFCYFLLWVQLDRDVFSLKICHNVDTCLKYYILLFVLHITVQYFENIFTHVGVFWFLVGVNGMLMWFFKQNHNNICKKIVYFSKNIRFAKLFSILIKNLGKSKQN